MKPEPPSPSDGSDPTLRSRPNLGITAKDSAEMDLWAFDDEEIPEQMRPPKPVKPAIPEPRYLPHGPVKEVPPTPPAKSKPSPSGLPEATPDLHDSIRVNVNPRSRPTFSPNPHKEPRKPAVRATSGENFDDLDQWEEPAAVAAAPAKPAPATMPPSTFKEMPRPESADEAPPPPAAETAPRNAKIEDDRDEFSTRIRTGEKPSVAALRPALHLNPIERLGLAVLVLLLIAAAAVFYISTIRQIPSGSGRVEAGDFPIQGAQVEALTAVTYWREPVTNGPDADTVQRETLLIPVAEFTTRGGPAVLRIFFRNEHGDLVGDAVTRSVQGEEKLKIAATAGFDDLGKHAAYRTGQTEPWTLEVLEAPAGNPTAADFKRLFVMNIGAELR